MSTSYEMLGKIPANKSIIPASCSSFVEASFYITEASTNVLNDMFKNIGITELAIFEATGSVVIYEGAKLDELKKKISAAFEAVWSFIKAGFEKILGIFKEKIKEFKERNFKLSRSDVSKLDKEVVEKMLGALVIHKFPKSTKKIINDIESIRGKNSTKFDFSDDIEDIDDAIDGLFGTYCKADKAVSQADMIKAIKDDIMGDIEKNPTKTWLENNISDINDTCINGTEIIKSAYKSMKKHVDDEQRRFNSQLKESNSDTCKKLLQYKIKNCNAAYAALSAAMKAELEKVRECTVIAAGATRLVKKYKGESVKESTDISSLFAW